MIPRSLTLKGIYSYQEKQHIDFTRLTEAQLFGIFGSVGSGKSTILEAITFALYGKTERLNEKDHRNYNMMNLKSDELLIDFEFETGHQQELYRFLVGGKRNQKHFERINTFERKAYQWQDNQWVPLESVDAESILGLSYENFKRTIIIPQGKFQEFLELSETDRTRMLKEIFNLERFELGEQVGHIEKKNNQELDRIQGELQGMEEITEEAKQEKTQASDARQKEKAELEKHYEEQKKRYDQLKQIKDINDQYLEAQKRMKDLEASKPSFDERQQNLEQYQQCKNYFKDKIDRINSLDKDIEQRETSIQQLQKQQQKKEKQVHQNQHKFDEIKKLFPDEKSLDKSITDLKTIIEVRGFQEELKKVEKELEKGKTKEKDASKKRNQLKDEKANLRDQINQEKEKKLDQGVLGAVKNWLTQKTNLVTNLHNYEQEVNKAKTEIENLKNQREAIITGNKLEQLQNDLPTLPTKDLQPALDQLKQRCHEELQSIEQSLVHYQTKQQLETYAQDLKDGEACPVCGAREHPDKLEPGDADHHIQRFEQKKKTQQNWIEAINQAMQDLEGLKKHYQTLKNQQDNYQAKYHEEQRKLDEHQKNFRWPAYNETSEAKIDELLKQAEEQSKTLEKLEQQFQNQEKALEEQETNVQQIEKQNQDLQQRANSYSERINSYKSQLSLLQFDDYTAIESEELQEKLKNWQKQHKEFQELEQTIEKLQHETEELKRNLTSKQEQLKEKQQERKDTNANLKHLIEQSNFENEGQIVKILDQEMDVEQEKAAIDEFQEQYNQQQGIVKDYTAKLKNQEPFKQEEFDKLYKTLEKEEQQIKEKDQNIAVLKQQIKDLTEKLAKKQELQQKHDQLHTRQENIKTLKSLFKGSGFVKYVSSVFLKELCNAANERFYKLTRQQLRLEVTEDNNFRVRDFLNNGRVRNIKTLSGGQMFQASLSLALALAENIQRLTQSHQNFFFLDEGFGSQDKESLNIVFETLKSLRKENRIVGVISHVEELKEEIDVALNVENDPESGSLVKGSWEV